MDIINQFLILCRKFIVRPYVCLWDWKRCAQGLMLISTTSSSHPFSSESALLSRLQLGEDNENGLCAVHIYEKTYSDSCRIHKDVFNLSTLSPSTMDEKLVLDEASPIILQCNSVMFPLFGKVCPLNFQLRFLNDTVLHIF